jgi:hypothetical protein
MHSSYAYIYSLTLVLSLSPCCASVSVPTAIDELEPVLVETAPEVAISQAVKSPPAEGQTADADPPSHAAKGKTVPRLNSVMLFAGADHRVETDLSLGLTYERIITPLFGLGFELEAATAGGEGSLFLPQVTYHPGGGLYLNLAPGLLFEEGEEARWMARTGVGYEWEVGKHLTLAAEFNYDWTSGIENSQVLGVVLGYRF